MKCKYGESKRFGFFTKLTASNKICAAQIGPESSRPDLQSRFQPFKVGAEVAKTVTGGLGLEKLKGWISECCNNHQHCLRSRDVPLPTRTIYVGTACGSEGIFLSCNNSRLGRYLALSHCWGGTVPFITTEATLKHRKEHIDLFELPQTFKDAVLMTQKFGYQHLWIDALCIIQDSPLDWEAESSKMAQVYTNADFTISALDAPDSHNGFLQDRAQDEAEVATISPNERIFVRPKLRRFRQVFEACPLSNRAWTFQEHFLSTALLHFSSKEAFWECRTCVNSESGDFLNVDTLTKSLMNIQQPEVLDTHKMWLAIVNDYSRRRLTFASDKLPALAGLAEKLSGSMGSEYLAGLWKNDLIEGLLWQSLGQADQTKELGQYRAPSWSWAALDRKVGYEDSLSKYTRVPQPGDLHILETHVDLAGQSKFGSVKHGFLRVLGSFRRPSLVPDVRNNFDNEIHLSRSRSYQYLRVATYKAQREPKDDTDRFCTCFLLLERHEDDQTYRRIGYAELWEDHKVSTAHVDIEETLEVTIV